MKEEGAVMQVLMPSKETQNRKPVEQAKMLPGDKCLNYCLVNYDKL